MSQSFEERLASLERSCRRWRIGFVSLLLSGVAVLVAAEKPPLPPQIIQARRIELVDAKGQAAIVLQTNDDGASLAVWAPDHQHVALLTSQNTKAALMLMKSADAAEVFAQATDHGGEIGVGNGEPGMGMNLSGGAGGFSLFHLVEGKPQSRLSFSKLGGGLELRTPGSRAVTSVVGSDRGGRVQILDPQGNLLWSAPPRQ